MIAMAAEADTAPSHMSKVDQTRAEPLPAWPHPHSDSAGAAIEGPGAASGTDAPAGLALVGAL